MPGFARVCVFGSEGRDSYGDGLGWAAEPALPAGLGEIVIVRVLSIRSMARTGNAYLTPGPPT